MIPSWQPLLLTILTLTTVYAADRSYRLGDPVPVSCVNRTIDTGEHVTDSEGRIQYVPFPSCSETGKPLQLYFGREGEVNCTIDFIDDTFFHLLEFYVVCNCSRGPRVEAVAILMGNYHSTTMPP